MLSAQLCMSFFFKENQRLIILRHDVLHKLHRQNGPYDDYDAGTYLFMSL